MKLTYSKTADAQAMLFFEKTISILKVSE